MSDAPDLNARLFPDGKHGTILYDRKGEIIATIDGHSYGKAELVELLKKAQ